MELKLELNELVARAVDAVTSRLKYQTPASVKFEDGKTHDDGQARTVLEIEWDAPRLMLRQPSSEELQQFDDAIRKAAENPGKTFEVGQ